METTDTNKENRSNGLASKNKPIRKLSQTSNPINNSTNQSNESSNNVLNPAALINYQVSVTYLFSIIL